MSDIQAQTCLRQDAEAIRERASEEAWIIDGPSGVIVDVRLRALDGENYWLRFICADYPDRPFSVKPINHETKRSDVVSAWPRCEGFRPMSDLCMPLCAEGYALHSEWAKDPRLCWRSEGNPLLRVLEELQIRLNDPKKYQGRMGK
jgi:hypothetical protein